MYVPLISLMTIIHTTDWRVSGEGNYCLIRLYRFPALIYGQKSSIAGGKVGLDKNTP